MNSSRSRLSGSCIRCSACCTRASTLPAGSSASISAATGGPLRHCHAASASRAASSSRKPRGSQRSLRKVAPLLFRQGIASLAVRQAQHAVVALGFMQLDALHQRAAVNLDAAENLLEQHRVRHQVQLPGLCRAAQLQLEIPGKAAVVTFEYGEKQSALLGGDILSRLLLPAAGRAFGDALAVDAVILLKRTLQLPEQAEVTAQHKLAATGQWLRQGAQVFLLNQRAAHNGGLGQLGAELVEVEGQRILAQQPEAEACQQAFHDSTFATASISTLGEANCISRVAISTATCTLLPRVMRSPVAASLIR